MDLQIVGLNHKTAPVAMREALAVPAEAALRHLPGLVRLPGIREAAIISTCNRVELVTAGGGGPEAVQGFLAGLAARPLEGLPAHLYVFRGVDAARHLVEVASSIDSLVVGETEILAQVKAAYQQAQAAGTVGRVLHASFQHALRAAKAIHATTRLGARRVSVGSVAAELAEKVFATLSGKTVLVIGAGEMAEATARTLREGGAGDLRIANRTAARAADLAARVGGRAVPLERLEEELPAADVLLACVTADGFLLGPADFDRALRARRRRPMVAVDIAVPRCIDPAAGDIEGLYLFNIDDLETVVKANLAARQEEIARCRPMVDEAVRLWEAQLRGADLGPLIARMRERYQRLAEQESERLLAAMPDLDPARRVAVADALRGLVGRFVHDQTRTIRAWAENGNGAAAREALQRLLDDSGRDGTGSGENDPAS